MANYSNRYFNRNSRPSGERSSGSRFSRDERADDEWEDASAFADRSARSRYLDERRATPDYDEEPYEDEGYEAERFDDGPEEDERFDAPRRRFRFTPPVILGAILLGTVLLIVLSIVLSRASARRAARYAAENPPYTTVAPGETVSSVQTAEEQAAEEAFPVAESADAQPAAEAGAEGGYTVLDGVPNTDRALGLAQGPQADNSFFDDAVFVGDAATLTLSRYVRDWRDLDYPSLLGKAQFLTLEDLSSRNALEPVSGASQHPVYQGNEMRVEDAVAAMKAGKVYLMLGSNDIAADGVETSATNLMLLARKIKDKSPNILIFIQSVTPLLRENGDGLTNEDILQYNLKLYEYCQRYASYGLYFVDAAYPLRDAQGNLAAQYCSDAQGQGRGLNAEACRVWITYLYTHTPQ